MISISQPCFVPRCLHNDNTYVSYGKWEMVNFFANFYYMDQARYRRIIQLASQQSKYLIVDPRTVMFQFGGHTGKPTYLALPYATPGGTTLSPSQFTPQFLRRYTDLVVKEQLDRNAGVLVPPYFKFANTSDPWLAVCERCCEAASGIAEGLPILMFVVVDSAILLNPQEIDNLVERLLALPADGYYLLVLDLPESSLILSQVTGYRRLVRGLARPDRIVLPAQVGRLGLALLSDGAAGYAAGFEKLDNVSAVSFLQQGGGPGRTTRYYLHTLLLHIYARTADNVAATSACSPEYPCACAHCNNALPTKIASKGRTLHYVDARMRELQQIGNVPVSNRQQHIKGMFDRAVSCCLTAQSELALKPFGGQLLPTSAFAHIVTMRDSL